MYVTSFHIETSHFFSVYLSGELELELIPQGSLAERCRAGGAGIPAFFTTTGFGTILAGNDFSFKLDG